MLATRNVRKFIIFLLDLELQIKNFSHILYIVRDTKAIGTSFDISRFGILLRFLVSGIRSVERKYPAMAGKLRAYRDN